MASEHGNPWQDSLTELFGYTDTEVRFMSDAELLRASSSAQAALTETYREQQALQNQIAQLTAELANIRPTLEHRQQQVDLLIREQQSRSAF